MMLMIADQREFFFTLFYKLERERVIHCISSVYGLAIFHSDHSTIQTKGKCKEEEEAHFRGIGLLETGKFRTPKWIEKGKPKNGNVIDTTF